MQTLDSILGTKPSRQWLASEEAHDCLSQVNVREQIYAVMHARPEHPDLLRKLLEYEVTLRKAEPETPAFENLYWCALLLYQLGRLEDVLPLWRAKNTNFDTACGFDAQFLVGAGIEETIAHLEASTIDEAVRAHAYVVECHSAGAFDDLASWLTKRRAYFAP